MASDTLTHVELCVILYSLYTIYTHMVMIFHQEGMGAWQVQT